MTNKSTGGNGRKKPVKKPTLQEQIDQTLKEADEQIKGSEVIRKKAEELLKKTEQEKQNVSNSCKHCLFQKECILFTHNSRFAHICADRRYDEEARRLIDNGQQALHSSLLFSKDTKEQFKKRFNLN